MTYREIILIIITVMGNTKKIETVKKGKFLFTLLRDRGWTLEDMANHFGISVSMVSRHFNGSRSFCTKKGMVIAEEFNIPLEYIYK